MPITEVSRFAVTYLQVLDERGNVDPALDPALPRETLRKLYRAMVRARHVDARMLNLQRQGRIGTFPPCTGHEAVSCGVTAAMADRDWFVGSYRELGGRLMRGDTVENFLAYYNGWEEGSALPASARVLPTQVILGSQLPHAVGIAYAMRYLGETDTAVVAFFGDGASSQGDFHEALNFAGVWQTPNVFICQNNGWAISVPRSMQTRSETLAQKAIAYGFPGVQVDGNDALAVYRATTEALARARRGDGPTLIEAITYRVMMHTTADDPTKYRDRSEEEQWWQRDPIPRLRAYLERKGDWGDADQVALEEEAKREVDRAIKRFEAQEQRRPDTPFDHVFGTTHPLIEKQREEFLAGVHAEADHA